MPAEIPEAELVARVQAGDGYAYNLLVQQHREAVFRLAYLISNNSDDAEDITQETFIRALKCFHYFDPTRPLRPWLLQITRNLARNQNRSWERYKHMLKRLFEGHQRLRSDVEAITHAQEQARSLHEAIRQLPGDYQDVIYTRYFLELSVDESAAVLGIAEGTVKSRSHRALKQLRALIEARYPYLKQEGDHG